MSPVLWYGQPPPRKDILWHRGLTRVHCAQRSRTGGEQRHSAVLQMASSLLGGGSPVGFWCLFVDTLKDTCPWVLVRLRSMEFCRLFTFCHLQEHSGQKVRCFLIPHHPCGSSWVPTGMACLCDCQVRQSHTISSSHFCVYCWWTWSTGWLNPWALLLPSSAISWNHPFTSTINLSIPDAHHMPRFNTQELCIFQDTHLWR